MRFRKALESIAVKKNKYWNISENFKAAILQFWPAVRWM